MLVKNTDTVTMCFISFQVKLVERVVIAMSAKVYVANLQGEQEASHKRYDIFSLKASLLVKLKPF